MKNLLFVLAAAAVAVPAFTNANGPGGGKSGSPASNGQTCSGCHSGASISTQSVSITTDIPSTGFVPNTNYQITVTNATGGASNPRSGFQASVESAGHQGSLTAGTGSKLVNSNFVTHTSSSIAVSNGQAAWTFTWNSGNAPDGTTIFVSSLFANGNGNDNGDAVATQSLALSRSTIGLDELLKQVNHTYVQVIDGLRREGFLSAEDANKLSLEYSVIVEQKSWLPPFLAKWVGMRDSQIGVRLARVVGREKRDD